MRKIDLGLMTGLKTTMLLTDGKDGPIVDDDELATMLLTMKFNRKWKLSDGGEMRSSGDSPEAILLLSE